MLVGLQHSCDVDSYVTWTGQIGLFQRCCFLFVSHWVMQKTLEILFEQQSRSCSNASVQIQSELHLKPPTYVVWFRLVKIGSCGFWLFQLSKKIKLDTIWICYKSNLKWQFYQNNWKNILIGTIHVCRYGNEINVQNIVAVNHLIWIFVSVLCEYIQMCKHI